ncbi:YqeG family HAD IIIA-type phosphatase [Syntrophomonas palmitatica]|uniref:YqeG family HAD IIIA-type phosphatase n=1 Tax=Syntrophomonas palmitatica TaxID=402877 RepID=UPI001FA79549|nr:hypothetical protein [Syntrophomonas palmitatica]
MKKRLKRTINKLYPKIYVNSVLDIPLNKLKAAGIKALIFDLDNTITEWNSNEIRSDINDWFLLVKSLGFNACLLSNNHEHRVLQVAESWVYRMSTGRRNHAAAGTSGLWLLCRLRLQLLRL